MNRLDRYILRQLAGAFGFFVLVFTGVVWLTQAVRLIDTGGIDVKPIITGSYDLDDAEAAFAAAGDRTRSVKVQFRFG